MDEATGTAILQGSRGSGGLLSVIIRESRVDRLAAADGVGDGDHGFCDGRFGAWPVE